ncbi:sensor histidine kinase [Paenibacillus rigui]|uniref:histidine kinase n=1 Tax=Paenibacillus rigui TaxID=554312 RepID=A0A229URA1_9BACL|nr:ATP-binding protein [Paenibacillus rigui]OXM85938.1 histidine kinase [Paenibacillus rigui]
MSYNWVLFVYTSVICTSSIYFAKTPTPLLLIWTGIIYIGLHFMDRRNKANTAYTIFQIITLVIFHKLSVMDWCLPLYLAQMGKQFYRIQTPARATTISLLYITLYALVAFTHIEIRSYEVFTLLFSSISCFILAILYYRYIHVILNQTQLLDNEKQHLSTHDALTGLYNYEECHRQLEHLVNARRPIVLVLMDCKDLKSHNTANGFNGVNRILKQAGQLLRIMFPEALFICRYGGDEFAIVLETQEVEQTKSSISLLLASEFPKLTGIEINYGLAFYPTDGYTKDDLISNAENTLYNMKRESWLKREEHMLRSEKLRVVGELASGMAHEIRNPLTTIKGFLQLSKADNFNIRPWYDLIMDEIKRMSMLTAEFLQFSKPHATQFKVHSIQDCIHRVISLLDSESARLGHYIEFQNTAQPIFMLMDQDKMLQLLLNLIKNAFEAMQDQGYVRIKLMYSEKHAIIEVSDTGKGIPESELDQIFLPFYTTKDSGTGLGLSICHKIVQDHEGTMEVESELGKGTKFIITVPTASQDTPPRVVPNEKSAADRHVSI